MLEHNREPFVRNYYYNGKPLKSEDFIKEQEYMIEKHRLLNRHVNGLRIFDGLNVEQVDDTHIKIERGIGIDYQGNEIIVPADEIREISVIDGYKDVRYSYNTYLYLRYKEEEIYSDSKVQEQVKESYELYLKEGLPLGFENDQVISILNDNGLNIYHVLQESALINEVIKGYLIIDKPVTKQVDVTVKVNIQRALTMDQLNTFSIEARGEKEVPLIKIPYSLRVTGKEDEKILIKFEEVIIKDEEERIIDVLEEFLIPIKSKSKQQAKSKELCLARLSLVDNDGKHQIKEVVPMTSEEEDIANTYKDIKPLTATTNVLQLMSNEDPRADIKVNHDKNELVFTFGLPRSAEAHQNNQISTGTVSIALGAGGKANRCYYSDYIDHCLGEGQAGIILAVEEKMKQLSGLPEPEEQLIFGNFSVFAESDCISKVPPVELGAILYPREGRMKIGVKLLQNTKLRKIDIRWWAYKNVNEVIEVNNDKDEDIKIQIKPDRIELKKGQKIQLKALVENTNNKNVTWRILDKEGGKITQKGFYTAPMVRGVYKIEATSVADFSRTATVIVVVKE
ncbi:Ig-like domain-containing protein [Vallitalea okinawensis]|uniref:Ig-like domain-containing protein n=1 Tax=Vallitalea okinawensis TaxID=2078660 RepID=UPI000CFCB6BD|nr:Ig-like domain-containing protein [Vallitalea okinawensis]